MRTSVTEEFMKKWTAADENKVLTEFPDLPIEAGVAASTDGVKKIGQYVFHSTMTMEHVRMQLFRATEQIKAAGLELDQVKEELADAQAAPRSSTAAEANQLREDLREAQAAL